jgi:hypothetical protein
MHHSRQTIRGVNGIYADEMSVRHYFCEFGFRDSGMIPWLPISKMLAAILALVVTTSPVVYAADVKITPLGSQQGEFCQLDRALILEDPDGTRLLYDAGRTVAGADDPRLGKIDAVLVSHMHVGHTGDKHIAEVGE